jgi:hypothetical protein
MTPSEALDKSVAMTPEFKAVPRNWPGAATERRSTVLRPPVALSRSTSGATILVVLVSLYRSPAVTSSAGLAVRNSVALGELLDPYRDVGDIGAVEARGGGDLAFVGNCLAGGDVELLGGGVSSGDDLLSPVGDDLDRFR